MKACGAETCWHVFKEPVALQRNKGLIKEIKAFKLSLSASYFLKNHPKLSFFMGGSQFVQSCWVFRRPVKHSNTATFHLFAVNKLGGKQDKLKPSRDKSRSITCKGGPKVLQIELLLWPSKFEYRVWLCVNGSPFKSFAVSQKKRNGWILDFKPFAIYKPQKALNSFSSWKCVELKKTALWCKIFDDDDNIWLQGVNIQLPSRHPNKRPLFMTENGVH